VILKPERQTVQHTLQGIGIKKNLSNSDLRINLQVWYWLHFDPYLENGKNHTHLKTFGRGKLKLEHDKLRFAISQLINGSRLKNRNIVNQKNASHDMGYLYDACDQISDLCHQ
jgi:hypothetical protein